MHIFDRLLGIERSAFSSATLRALGESRERIALLRPFRDSEADSPDNRIFARELQRRDGVLEELLATTEGEAQDIISSELLFNREGGFSDLVDIPTQHSAFLEGRVRGMKDALYVLRSYPTSNWLPIRHSTASHALLKDLFEARIQEPAWSSRRRKLRDLADGLDAILAAATLGEVRACSICESVLPPRGKEPAYSAGRPDIKYTQCTQCTLEARGR